VIDGRIEDEALRIAAAVEQSSEHPLAAAIVSAARERRLRCHASAASARWQSVACRPRSTIIR
jgi:cation transport ATPase